MLLFVFSILQLFLFLNLSKAESHYIVSGTDVDILDVPYQVSIYTDEKFFCGGSLIRPNLVLTAVHCVINKDLSSLSVRAGSKYIGKGGELRSVIRKCLHPKYSRLSVDYDVAVLKLNHSFTLGPAIKLINLQPINATLPIGTYAMITGWGRTSDGGPRPTSLQKAQVPKLYLDLCATWLYPHKVTNRMTCYGYKEGLIDACKGDSGGPLVVNDRQIGIVSWGLGCAAAESPGIYTDITNEEVQEHIQSCLST